jgi:hypothetical protein
VSHIFYQRDNGFGQLYGRAIIGKRRGKPRVIWMSMNHEVSQDIHIFSARKIRPGNYEGKVSQTQGKFKVPSDVSPSLRSAISL